MRRLGAADYAVMPWKNGLGSTLELARWPARQGAGLGAFDWRVSVASVVEDGPFSRFEGVDRVLVVLEGAGMVLTHDGGAPVHLASGQPHTFSGDAVTVGALVGGPVRDFNVMTRRGVVEAEVRVFGAGAHNLGGGGRRLIYEVRGAATVEIGGEVLPLSAGETALEGGAGLDAGRVWVEEGGWVIGVVLRDTPGR